jgi:hypothetical protein
MAVPRAFLGGFENAQLWKGTAFPPFGEPGFAKRTQSRQPAQREMRTNRSERFAVSMREGGSVRSESLGRVRPVCESRASKGGCGCEGENGYEGAAARSFDLVTDLIASATGTAKKQYSAPQKRATILISSCPKTVIS